MDKINPRYVVEAGGTPIPPEMWAVRDYDTARAGVGQALADAAQLRGDLIGSDLTQNVTRDQAEEWYGQLLDPDSAVSIAPTSCYAAFMGDFVLRGRVIRFNAVDGTSWYPKAQFQSEELGFVSTDRRHSAKLRGGMILRRLRREEGMDDWALAYRFLAP